MSAEPTLCTSYRWRPDQDLAVHGYHPTAEAVSALADLRSGDGWLPTSSITQALVVLSGGFVHWTNTLDPDQPLVVSQVPITAAQLSAALTSWERIVRAHRGLPPARTPLGGLVSNSPTRLDVGAHLLRRAAAVPDAPDWLFRAATWDVVSKLHRQKLQLDTRTVELRSDSAATLYAWSDPIINGDDQATYRIKVRALTVPGVDDLVISLQPHVSQNPTFIGACDHLTVELPETELLLDLAINHSRSAKGAWRTAYADWFAEVVDACHLHGLPPLDEDVLTKRRDDIRGRGRRPQTHFSIGTGVGSRFQHHLAVQAAPFLDSSPIELSTVPKTNLPAIRKRMDAAGIASSARDTGRGLRIVCLYDRPPTRQRMVDAISHQLGIDGAPDRDHEAWNATIAGDWPIEVSFRQDPVLLRPGDMASRTKRLDRLPDLAAGDRDALTLVLCETEIPEGSQRSIAVTDPKPQLRRLLARRGHVSQFLVGSTDGLPKDYAALGAVADLCQSGGLLDDRYDDLVGRLGGWPAGAWLVGVHWRKLRRPRTGSAFAIAALELGEHPRALGWLPGKGWSPLPDAMAAFQADRIEGSGRRRGLDHGELVNVVHAAVAQIPRTGGTSVVLFAGPGQRRVWPALTNRHYRNGPIPSDSADGARFEDVSVIRVTVDQGELVNPAARADPDVDSRDARTGLTTRLHVLDGDHDADTWYLVHKSRHAGRKGAPEARHDRHSLMVEDTYRQQRQNWHALTVTELAVIRAAAGQDAAQLARLGAELCQRAPTWDGRLTRPTPLHFAHRMLNDHPDRIAEET
jgi:hypothetical protein